MSNPLLFAVVGNPVFHSKSPLLFHSAFQHTDMNACYLKILANNAKQVMQLAKGIGLKGFNVTAPFKKILIDFIDSVDPTANHLQAVNTVYHQEGHWKGTNTDVQGVLGAMKQHQVPCNNKKAVILGAGGAGRAAAYALQSEGADVTFINRTLEKGEAAAKRLQCNVTSLENLSTTLKDADILISCVSTHTPLVTKDMLHPNLTVMDANYEPSSLHADALSAGCKVINGLSWLLHQATAAYAYFVTEEPSLENMKQTIQDFQKPKNKSNIALIGFMGSGKTVVAKALADLTNQKWVDTDASIERKTGQSISQIFQTQGEEAFRKLEHNEAQGLHHQQNTVFALGGGVVKDPSNVSAIKQAAHTIWLWVSPEDIQKRIPDPSTRPLIKPPNTSESQSNQDFQNLFQERQPLYARASDLVINTHNKTPEQLARMIADELHKTHTT